MQKVKAVIHIKSILDNATQFCSPTRKLCAVVKANAYGHGAEEIVGALQSVVDCFAVALIEEGIAIRTAACGKDILIFTPPLTEEDALVMIENDFLITISDLHSAKSVATAARKSGRIARVHIKVNTGMNRYGVLPIWTGRICAYLQERQNVAVTGIYSHLYTTDRTVSEKQRDAFCRAVEMCRNYYPRAIAHLGGTYAALLDERFAFDMVRVGIGLYGYLPYIKEENRAFVPVLRKGMTVYAPCATTRRYVRGGCGYGECFLERQEEAALTVLRVGYADGFLRSRGNGTDGAEKNVNALCMDACIRCGRGEIGRWTAVMSDADKTAKATGTISYEVLCAATRRAECIYVYD